jgi:hypothetical protein
VSERYEVRTFPTIPKKAAHPNEEGQIWLSAMTFLSTSSTMVPRPTFKDKSQRATAKRLSIKSEILAGSEADSERLNKFTTAKRDGFNSSVVQRSYLCNLNLNFKKRLLFMMYKRR